MKFARILLALLGTALLTSACAKPPERRAVATAYSPATQASHPPSVSNAASTVDTIAVSSTVQAATTHQLAGREIVVASAHNLELGPREVLLTFDDGPNPRVTPLILAALQKYGVKATFFMVGKMAQNHAETALAVADAGHTIASHTHNHENLVSLQNSALAMQAIVSGERAVAHAIAPAGARLAPFFRFPYLAQTRALRAELVASGFLIFDIDVDSRDFERIEPDVLLERTLLKLDKQGRGIVLFHDVHMRTALMLPNFLQQLEQRGFKIVHAVPASEAPLFAPIVVAGR